MPTATFQQGSSYSGTLDTTLFEAKPNSISGTATQVYIDSATGVNEQALLEFTNLFGSGAGQIPIGATITSAVLTLNVTNASGHPGSIYDMTTGWDENSTWNSLGGGVQIGVETASTPDLTLGKISSNGAHDFDVTSSLQSWLSGATTADQANAANDGWLFNGGSSDAWAFSSSEGSVAPTLVVTYTLSGSPPPPQLALEGPVSLNEGTSASPTNFVFTVDRTGDTSGAVSVDYAVTGTGAHPADASDFASGVLPSGTITFAAGQTSQTITIPVAADSNVESDETFLLSLTNPTNGAQVTGATAAGTILNDDSTGTSTQLALEGPVSLNEGTSSTPTSFVFTVDRTGDTSSAGTVDYAVTGSGANPANASDFASGVLPSGTISFAAGQTSQTITVNVAADSTVENNETFLLSLSNATNGAQITGATATGTILNDDTSTRPQLSFEGPVSLAEGTSSSPTSFIFTVDRTGDTSSAGTVQYAVTGTGTHSASASDFESDLLPSGSINFAAGQTSQTITIHVAADSIAENDETFLLSLSNATGGGQIVGGTAIGTILDDDSAPPPAPASQLAFQGPVSQAEGTSESPTSFVFTINRTGDASAATSVDYNVAGSGTHPATFSDFTDGVMPSGTVSFAAGQTSATVTINVVGDTSVEPNENFTVTLSNPADGASITGATATGTIVNDDTVDGLVTGVREIDGSTYGNGDPSSVNHYGSTDPTDIAYNPADGTLYLVDSEIDEKPFYGTVNMWHLNSQGYLIAPDTLEAFTKEPTGAAIWVDPSSGSQYLFISDDDVCKVFEVALNDPSTVLHTFSTKSFGCEDPEDLSINPNNGDLFVLSENDHKIYEVTQAGKLVATTVLPDTFVPHPDPNMADGGAEALAYDPVKDAFWVTGGFSEDIFEVSRSGQILNMVNTLEQYPNPSLTAINAPQTVYPKGLALAPSSDGSGHLSLWVTDYGIDQYPDGRVFEIMLNEMAPSSMQSSATTSASPLAAQNLALASPQPDATSDLPAHEASLRLGAAAPHPEIPFGVGDEWASFHHSDYLL